MESVKKNMFLAMVVSAGLFSHSSAFAWSLGEWLSGGSDPSATAAATQPLQDPGLFDDLLPKADRPLIPQVVKYPPLEDLTNVPFEFPPLVSEYPQPEKMVVLGDIHGDGQSLSYVLKQNGLIDEKENWIGQKTMLVMLGDLLDRGYTSRIALDLLMKLEPQAEKAGGKVVTLLGNHEFLIIAGDLRYFSKSDALNYRFSDGEQTNPRDDVLKAFSTSTKYGRWLIGKPAMVKIGRTLYTHGGIEGWVKSHKIADVNQMIRNWMAFFLGLVKAQPPQSTAGAVGDHGPMWTRALSEEKVPEDVFATWLAAVGVDQLVVGHTIVDKVIGPEKVAMYHGKLIKADTGMSKAIGGVLSSLIVTKNPDGSSRFDAKVFQRPAALAVTQDTLFVLEDGIDYVPAPEGMELSESGPMPMPGPPEQ